jgi:hypothetical protein
MEKFEKRNLIIEKLISNIKKDINMNDNYLIQYFDYLKFIYLTNHYTVLSNLNIEGLKLLFLEIPYKLQSLDEKSRQLNIVQKIQNYNLNQILFYISFINPHILIITIKYIDLNILIN